MKEKNANYSRGKNVTRLPPIIAACSCVD